ncbi:MAG: hypothetical protein ACTSVO_00745 [Candidatus Heimdallarchaeaceae archaeon]
MIKIRGHLRWRDKSSLENSFVNYLNEFQWTITGIYRNFVFAKSSEDDSLHCFMIINICCNADKPYIPIYEIMRNKINSLYKVFFYVDDYINELKLENNINKFTIVVLTGREEEFGVRTPFFKDNKITLSSNRERFARVCKMLCKRIGFWAYFPKNLTKFHEPFNFSETNLTTENLENNNNIKKIVETFAKIVEDTIEDTIEEHNQNMEDTIEKQTRELKKTPIIANIILNIIASVIYGIFYENLISFNADTFIWLPFIIIISGNIIFWLVIQLYNSRKELKVSLLRFLDTYFSNRL